MLHDFGYVLIRFIAGIPKHRHGCACNQRGVFSRRTSDTHDFADIPSLGLRSLYNLVDPIVSSKNEFRIYRILAWLPHPNHRAARRKYVIRRELWRWASLSLLAQIPRRPWRTMLLMPPLPARIEQTSRSIFAPSTVQALLIRRAVTLGKTFVAMFLNTARRRVIGRCPRHAWLHLSRPVTHCVSR